MKRVRMLSLEDAFWVYGTVHGCDPYLVGRRLGSTACRVTLRASGRLREPDRVAKGANTWVLAGRPRKPLRSHVCSPPPWAHVRYLGLGHDGAHL